MTNNINITWTSDQRQLMADMQKRQLMVEKDLLGLKKTADAGKLAGTTLTSSYREANKEIERLGRVATTSFKQPVSAIDKHLDRMKELRVLYRMGKIDAEQFNKSASASLKQKYSDSGMIKELQLRKQMSAELHAQQVQQQARERESSRNFYTERQRYWAAERTATAQDAAEKKSAAASLRAQKIAALRSEHEARRAAAEQVRRGLMTEQQLARETFIQRRQHLTTLRNEQAISSSEFRRAMQQARDEAKKVSQVDIATPWRDAIGPMASVLTAAGAISTIVRQAVAEMENLKTVQRNALNTTLTFAAAEEQAQQSLDGTLSPEELNSTVKRIAKKNKVSPTAMMRQANEVLGVKDDRTTAKEALDVMGELSEFTRLNPDDGAAVVSAVLGLKQALPEASTKELFGIIQQGKISSKVGTTAKFSRNIIPGASASRAYGDTPQQFIGMASAIGGQMQDVEGMRTGTAIVDLEKDLQILSAGVESGSLGGEKIKGGLGSNTHERIRAIAYNPKFRGLRDRLLGENEDPEIAELFKSAGRMTTESKSYGAIRLLYQGDVAAHAALDAKIAEQVSGKAAVDLVRKQEKAFTSTPEQVTARANSRVEAASETARLNNQTGARGALTREGLTKLLQDHGLSDVEQLIQSIRFEGTSLGGTSAPASQAARILDDRAKQQERGSMNPAFAAAIPGSPIAALMAYGDFMLGQAGINSGIVPRQAPTPGQLETAQALREAADAIRDLVEIEKTKTPVNVQVIMPGGGEKPAPPPAAGLQNRS
ncbi:MAG TPA: hypothetical protein VGM98_24845 [Schlesneria sp.]